MNKQTDEIYLRSGKLKKPIDSISPEDIHLSDIAWSLARTHRFGGQSRWTVARHSVLVACLVECEQLKAAALLHDAAEAYLGDLPSFIKAKCPAYIKLELKVLKVIFKRFGVKWPSKAGWKKIKAADNSALVTEKSRFYAKESRYSGYMEFVEMARVLLNLTDESQK